MTNQLYTQYLEWRKVSEEMLRDGYSGSLDCGEEYVREDFSDFAELEETISFEDMFELENKYEEATPMKETKTFETLLEATEAMLIKTYNSGVRDNQAAKGYCVVDTNADEAIIIINQRQIFQHNTDEELENMNWDIYAEECLETEGLDKTQEGCFKVEAITDVSY